MAWTEGRRLGSVTVGGKSFTYTYDRNGIRSGKTSSDGSSRKYYLVDGKAVGETVYKANGSFAYNLRYTFDENGSVCGISYWGPGATAWTKYYFTKNLQGDVTAVYRVEAANNQIAGFTKVAAYTYDAWGNVLSQSGDFATINPFRYRSYYYDTETGFYYLQSRYYDPAIGRFVSADSFASTGQSFLGYNMFAYCNNDPINYVDPTGEAWWHWAAAAGIVVAATAAVVITAGGVAPAWVAMVLVANGIVAGSTAVTVTAGVAVGAGTAFAVSAYGAATEASTVEEFADYGGAVLVSTAVGGVAGRCTKNGITGKMIQLFSRNIQFRTLDAQMQWILEITLCMN